MICGAALFFSFVAAMDSLDSIVPETTHYYPLPHYVTTRVMASFVGLCPNCAVEPGNQHLQHCSVGLFTWSGWPEGAICSSVFGFGSAEKGYFHMRRGSLASFVRWRREEARLAEQFRSGLLAGVFQAIVTAQLSARHGKLDLLELASLQEVDQSA